MTRASGCGMLNHRYLLAAACSAIALLFSVFWPHRKHPEFYESRSRVFYIIVRWFHPATWVLLAMASLFQSKTLALGSLLTYVIFIITLLDARRRNQ